MTRHAERALPGTENGREFRVATDLHQPSYLLCTFFACIAVGTHIRSNTGSSGCRYALSTSIGQTHSSCICTRKASWGEQGTSSRRVHTTLLRAALSGSWHRHRRQCYLGFIEEQESPYCSSQSFGSHNELW